MYRLGYCKFLAANRKSHLRKWQGVVGRAFSSPDVLFCKDVTQLSIIDYPLAHFARVEELGGCFAICLQSSCTGNDIYVLECFMPPSHKDYEELGEHLYIEEIPFQNGEKLDSVQMSQTTKSVPRLEPLQSGGEMTQLDLSNQQSMDALNNESNVVSAERSNIDVTCSQEKGKTKRPKRVHNKNGVKIEIPLDDILQNSKKSIQAAADNLKVSRSTLKRVCRSYGFPRWPPRKKNMVGQSQPSEFSRGVDHQQISQLSFDLPFNQASATVVHANPHNIAIEDANIVTMRAKYINNITIKFRLSLSPGQVELQQQIAKRLHLEAGSYNVKYKDEEDHVILIACDDDLQDCISTYRLLGTSINVRHRGALDEINKVLKVVREDHGLLLAQAWAPCGVDCTCRALVKGDIFHVIHNFNNRFEYCQFLAVNSLSGFRKWQGVVGRAFSSPNVLLCKDVTQLSIIDYPLAHYARYHKLGCCFAICLQSSFTGNDIYVLECFMPPSNKDYYGNQQTALRKILETMKKNFHSFKLASGEELGGHLYIEEIPFQNVSRSTLKRVCRGYGFPGWPPRKKNMVGQSQPSESSRGVDHQQISQLSFDLPTVVHANPHNIAIEDANIVTMRAKYINDITIKFRLSLSSSLVELQQQIAKRLHLEAGSYYVKYKDEEDHAILIACDDDLQDCISTYRLLGTSIVVLIDPK
ncbi:hypothetical protein CsSME_00050717 [Camellia sinensis var. sinensis]